MTENAPATDRPRIAATIAAIIAGLIAFDWGAFWLLGHVLWPAFARWAMKDWHF